MHDIYMLFYCKLIITKKIDSSNPFYLLLLLLFKVNMPPVAFVVQE